MEAYKTNTLFNKDLQIWFSNLPIEEGQNIEVIVIPIKKLSKDYSQAESLTGSVLEYNLPFEPAISENDWEAIN